MSSLFIRSLKAVIVEHLSIRVVAVANLKRQLVTTLVKMVANVYQQKDGAAE